MTNDEPTFAQVCPDCGRPFPPHEGAVAELQGCGRLAVPVPHVGLCLATNDRGGFAVRWSTQPVQTSIKAALPAVGSFHG